MIIKTNRFGSENLPRFQFQKLIGIGELEEIAFIELKFEGIYLDPIQIAMSKSRLSADFRNNPSEQSGINDMFRKVTDHQSMMDARKKASSFFFETLLNKLNDHENKDNIEPSDAPAPAVIPYFVQKEYREGYRINQFSTLRNSLKTGGGTGDKNKDNFVRYVIFNIEGAELMDIDTAKDNEALFDRSIQDTILELAKPDFDFHDLLSDKPQPPAP